MVFIPTEGRYIVPEQSNLAMSHSKLSTSKSLAVSPASVVVFVTTESQFRVFWFLKCLGNAKSFQFPEFSIFICANF